MDQNQIDSNLADPEFGLVEGEDQPEFFNNIDQIQEDHDADKMLQKRQIEIVKMDQTATKVSKRVDVH